MHILTKGQKAEIVRRCREGEKQLSIATDLGLTQKRVSYYARRAGLFRYRNWSDQDIARINDMYAAGMPTIRIAPHFGVTDVTIQNVMRRAGIPCRDTSSARRQYTINEAAFDAITDESTYWIGFLMADGSVGNGVRDNVLELTLSECDNGHVVAFRNFLGANNPLYRKPGRWVACKNKWYWCKPCVRLQITSERLCNRLISLGVRNKKTFRTDAGQFINSPHFWRGIVDGDGCICISNGCVTVSALGSEQLMIQLAAFIKSIAPDCRATVAKRKNIFGVRASGRFAIPVLRTLYTDFHVALPRKLALAHKFLAAV